MLPQEVFLSHSSQDSEFVARLAETLRQHGVPVWYSGTDILGAQQWHDEIGEALERCDWFIVVLSPHSIESMWVRREVQFALQQARLVNRIIPAVVRECEGKRLSWVLSSLQTVNFQNEFDEGCRTLLRIWGTGYRPVSST
jgi:hypothetical protein